MEVARRVNEATHNLTKTREKLDARVPGSDIRGEGRVQGTYGFKRIQDHWSIVQDTLEITQRTYINRLPQRTVELKKAQRKRN